MSTVMYHCPNCGGSLVFNPQTQQFECEFCMSNFTEWQVKNINKSAEEKQEEPIQEEEKTGNMALFTCPSCGAEIVTDETTAATFCYYCHNPVVLSGRLEGKFEPDAVIPFAIDKESAVSQFLEWVGKKKFVPKAFFSKKQIEKITGIYFPYWVTDCDLEANLSGKAVKVKSWRSGDIEYTEKENYYVERDARVRFDGITKKALSKETEAWVENIQPFDLKKMQGFNEAYLLGFQAEKRNIEKEELESEITISVKSNAEAMVRRSLTQYDSVHPDYLGASVKKMKWYYTLFPVWILTYRNKGDQVYYYAMNGQTGEISGKLPIDKKKLIVLSVCITAVCTIIGAFL